MGKGSAINTDLQLEVLMFFAQHSDQNNNAMYISSKLEQNNFEGFYHK